MASGEPHISASSLRGLAEFLADRYGRALEPLLTECKISARPPWETADPVPLRKYAALLELAADRTQEPAFGLAYGQHFPVAASTVLGFLIGNAPTLRDFVTCLNRYSRLMIDAVDVKFDEHDGLLKVQWDYSPTFIGPRRQLTDFLMTLFMMRANHLIGQTIVPVTAEFEHREPDEPEQYHAVFGRCLRFGAQRNSVTIRGEFLARSGKRADATLFGIMKKVADQEIQQIGDSGDIISSVRRVVLDRIGYGHVDLEMVATMHGVSSRQLQILLKRKGTTFEGEVARLREELARRYLQETDLPMTDIAMRLGFSEQSSFSRAARQWFGMPPTQYRESARGR